jgi:hypothetical protein
MARRYILFESVTCFNVLINWMLTIVIAKPMLLTMEEAVPFISATAFWATKVEKSGVCHDHPKKSKAINTPSDLLQIGTGNRQQTQDSNKI